MMFPHLPRSLRNAEIKGRVLSVVPPRRLTRQWLALKSLVKNELHVRILLLSTLNTWLMTFVRRSASQKLIMIGWRQSSEPYEPLLTSETDRSANSRSSFRRTSSANISREQEEVTVLRRRVLEFRADRDEAENELDELLAEARKSVGAVRGRIEHEFSARAADFLLETFRLVYSPDRRTVGQTGRQLEFPAFEVELTGGAIEGRAVRRTAVQVSFFQREYLDLAFRMAVMAVVASDASTLIVDGPETSVDAVFGSRAGELLASYARGGGAIGNRLLVTCNVVATPLIPTMLEDYAENGGLTTRVINLLHLAAPTAALDRLKPEYEEAYRQILGGASPGP